MEFYLVKPEQVALLTEANHVVWFSKPHHASLSLQKANHLVLQIAAFAQAKHAVFFS